MLRGLVTTFIGMLVLYAPLELSRLILWYDTTWYFVFELALIWVFYLAAVAIVYKLIKVR